MSYALSRPTNTRRSSLLGIVVGLHVGIFLVIASARSVAPQIMELPLVVDLLQPVESRPPEATPKPVAKPQPVREKPHPVPAPKAPPSPLEATHSEIVAPAAPVAAPVVSPPTPPSSPISETLTPARFDADYLRNPAPPYPPIAKRMGEEGKVVLRVSVNPQGSADSVEIRTSSGSARLDESAQKTVRNWKFIPAKRGDQPVQSSVLVPIIFKLEQ